MVGKNLGHAVWTAWVKARGFRLRALRYFAEHLRTRRLEKFCFGRMLANGFEHAQRAEARDIGCKHGLVPGNRDKTLGREVIDLVRLDLFHGLVQRALVGEIALDKADSVRNMLNAIVFLKAASPHQAVDFVTLVQQELRQVGSILAGDSGNQRSHAALTPQNYFRSYNRKSTPLRLMIYRDFLQSGLTPGKMLSSHQRGYLPAT